MTNKDIKFWLTLMLAALLGWYLGQHLRQKVGEDKFIYWVWVE